MLSEALRSGAVGVRFAVPPTWEVMEEHEGVLQAADRETGVLWRVLALPWGLDLGPSYDEALGLDLARDATFAFERTFKEIRAEQGPSENPLTPEQPRTAGGDWSPLVEYGRVQLGVAASLRFVYRAAMMPGHEHVIGRLQIPTQAGVVQISAHALINETGFRESALYMVAKARGHTQPTQAMFDAGEHDASFPNHPLSRVREALRWVAERLEVLQPAGPLPDPIDLPEAQSIVNVPPRYRRLPPGTLPVAPTIANFTRVGFDAGMLPRMCEVYQIAEARLRPDDREGLQQLADEVTKSWESTGVQRLSWKSSWCPDRRGRVELALRVKFRTPDPVHSAQYFTVDRDGTPFRFSVSSPRYVPFKEIALDAEVLARSWRRMGT